MNSTPPSGLGTSPRLAATLVILRQGAAGLEVLLTVRPRHLRFMGGAVVFPGGALAPADRDERWKELSEVSAEQASEHLGEPDPATALAFMVCALREAFEEVGFPAMDGAASISREDVTPEAFLAACLARGSRLNTGRLVYAGRWVTPSDSPIRFDTRFFLCLAPSGFEPTPSIHEVDDCYWSTPAAALEELADGRVIMAPPTIDVLQRLNGFSSAVGALGAVVDGSLSGGAEVLRARLSPLVQVVIAPNGGPMTGPGTNTYVVGRGPAWCIDPAVTDAAYVDAVAHAAGDVAGLLITHRHPDHVGGARALVARTEAPVYAFDDRPLEGLPVRSIRDGEILEIDDLSLRVLHAPGHTPDHLCFLLEAERALFAGDNVMGEGTPVIDPPEGHMRTYLDTIRRLSELDLDRIYPGHFRALERPREVLQELLEHRAERERAIVRVLQDDAGELSDIVRRAYSDTPSDLHDLAARSALAHLEMLEEDDKVVRDGRVWRWRTRQEIEGQARQPK